MAGPLVLFDGVCAFCNSSVHFIIDHDPQGWYSFAPLQSPTGRRFCRDFHLEGIDSLVLVENHRVYVRSTAALRIARKLSGGWSWLALLLAIPAPLRDAAYDAFARRRYRWFGKMEACRLPTPAWQARFVDQAMVTEEGLEEARKVGEEAEPTGR